jgi:hypothetical protein
MAVSLSASEPLSDTVAMDLRICVRLSGLEECGA